MWADDNAVYTDTVSLDMSTVVPTISGPKRPQDKVLLTEAAATFKNVLKDISKRDNPKSVKVENNDFELEDGKIVNCSNYVLYQHIKSKCFSWCWNSCKKSSRVRIKM